MIAVEVVEAVNTVSIVLKAVAVITVFAKVRVHDQIAVLAGACIVYVFGILRFPINVQVLIGNRGKELPHLLEERPMKIHGFPVLQRIPFITQVTLPAVNRKRMIGLEFRNNVLPAHATGIAEEREFITNQQPALLPAIRTKSRRRDGIPLPTKYG
jgi:hypothetical protein